MIDDRYTLFVHTISREPHTVETRLTPYMKGLVARCVIGHIRNYNFNRGNIYEEAKIGLASIQSIWMLEI